MKLSITSLCTGYYDSDLEYVLDSEDSKYLFNVRDGTQRVCSEHAIRLSRLKGIFISRISPDTLGGLPGMLLSIYDMGVHELVIYGPEGLADYFKMLEMFIWRPDYKLTITEIADDITEIPLSIGCIVKPYIYYTSPVSEYTRETVHISECMDLTISAVHRKEKRVQSEISYMIQVPTIPGKFCIEKAKALGIPKGPLYKELATGNSITLDGKVITSEMVMNPSIVGPSVLLLNVHKHEILFHFTESSLYSELSKSSLQSTLLAVFHNIPANLLPSLQLPHFPPNIQLLFLADSPRFFPIAHSASTAVSERFSELFPPLFPRICASHDFPLSPKGGRFIVPREQMEVVSKNPGSFIEPSIEPLLPFSEEEKQTSTLLAEKLEICPKTGIPGKLLFLGTGSAVPSKYRNVSSSLLKLEEHKCILLDCGEGTLNQLLRLFPEIPAVLHDIKVIVISHSHADHNLGLPLLLQFITEHVTRTNPMPQGENMQKKVKVEIEPIFVIAPRRVRLLLDYFTEYCPSLRDAYKFVEFDLKNQSYTLPSNKPIFSVIQYYLNLKPLPPPEEVLFEHTSTNVINITIPGQNIELSLFPMVHTDDSAAVIVKYKTLSFLYTGDGRPATNIHDFYPDGIKVDVLLNECTFTNDKKEHAIAKNHCTMEEALEVARIIPAKFCILTHFSQRYPKNLMHDQGAKEQSTVTLKERAGDYNSFICAHDLMEVNFDDLNAFCEVRDQFEDCFIDEDDK